MATVKRTLKSVQNAFCIIDKHHPNPHNCKSFIMKFEFVTVRIEKFFETLNFQRNWRFWLFDS